VERPDLAAALEQLKGFQRSTVEYAFRRLYLARDSTRRFLVADEVGLGKTLVARGVIARAIGHLWDRVERIDIVYVCSNASIARQNVNRLTVPGTGEYATAERLTLLPLAPRDLGHRRLNFIALTPGTSLDLKSNTGVKRERLLLHWFLQKLWPRRDYGPAKLFQATVRSFERFRRAIKEFAEDDAPNVDQELAERFFRALKGSRSLRNRYHDLADEYRRRRVTYDMKQRASRLIGDLRELLARTCLRALEPDIVILDEFQRFKHLLEKGHDESELAHDLFNYSDESTGVRVLLLSATPYKMYTLKHEEHEDDHYEDFLRTVDFLRPDDKRGQKLRDLLARYRREVYGLGPQSVDALRFIKDQIQQYLGTVICRTERVRETAEKDAMLREVPASRVELTPADVRTFLGLQRVGHALGQPSVVGYWKSAPYPLNFMDQYRLKQELCDGLHRPEVVEELAAARGLLLRWHQISRYEPVEPSNPRLRALIQDMTDQHAWELLWVPPCAPYYDLTGAFKAAKEAGFTKRLLFSAWTVVPRSVSALVTYESERRLFTAFEDAPKNTEQARKRRRGLLRFAKSERRLTGMPVLACLYPSPYLATVGDPARRIVRSLDDHVREVEDALLPALDALKGRSPSTGEPDEAWYWVAPILLDLLHDEETAKAWLRQEYLEWWWTHPGESETQVEEDAGSRWGDHVAHAASVLDGEVELGRMPDDLSRVLALLAAAGPAVCALRALARSNGGSTAYTDLTFRNRAAAVAWGFRTLFNRPESMALVRAKYGSEPYWRQMLQYCAEGCLQAVLDEYVHVLRDLLGLFGESGPSAATELAQAMQESLQRRTPVSRLDEIRLGRAEPIRRRGLRSQFAMRFGEDEVEEITGTQREDIVRSAFNSPFWPFVLATTSIGQEGLDFHAYCHAVVHWDLPWNPVDLEQREGRVHRYKGHAIRKNVARRHGALATSARGDPWEAIFEGAVEEMSSDATGLRPYWVYPAEDGAAIERHVPALPLSRDEARLNSLRRTLAVYRMVFGQPRQDDLVAFLMSRIAEEDLVRYEELLRIDLSPVALQEEP